MLFQTLLLGLELLLQQGSGVVTTPLCSPSPYPTDPVLAAILSTLGDLTVKVANMNTQIRQLGGLTGLSCFAMAPMPPEPLLPH